MRQLVCIVTAIAAVWCGGCAGVLAFMNQPAHAVVCMVLGVWNALMFFAFADRK